VAVKALSLALAPPRTFTGTITFTGTAAAPTTATAGAQGCGSNWALANLNFSSRLYNLFAAKSHSRRDHGDNW
jgi:hypothetical protein